VNAPDSSALHGIWQVVRAELGGQPMPDDAAAHVELEFSATGYAVRFGGETTDAGTYALAADGTPRGITMTGRVGVNQGRTLPGIVQLQGDRLRVCFSLEGDTAPNAFAAPAGTLCYLATYRRKA
jgi:uncharacterized protein (TIGR03067 family)